MGTQHSNRIQYQPQAYIIGEKYEDDIISEARVVKETNLNFSYSVQNLNKSEFPVSLSLSENLINKNFLGNGLTNCFCDIYVRCNVYIAYPTPQNSIEIFNLNSKTIHTTLKGHTKPIWSLKRYTDNLINVLISSSSDKTIRVFNVNSENFECISVITTSHESELLYSFTIYRNINTYIVTSSWGDNVLKFYGLDSKNYGEMKTKKGGNVYFLDIWCDMNTNKYYLINANSNDVQLIDIITKQSKVFQKGLEHHSALIIEDEKVTYLLEGYSEGLNLWDIKLNLLIYVISMTQVCGLVRWDREYVLACDWENGSIKVLDLKSGKIVKEFSEGHKNYLSTILKIYHPEKGDCLVSGGWENKILLWTSTTNH